MEHVFCRALVFVVVFRLLCVVLKIICSYCVKLYRLITTYFEFTFRSVDLLQSRLNIDSSTKHLNTIVWEIFTYKNVWRAGFGCITGFDLFTFYLPPNGCIDNYFWPFR